MKQNLLDFKELVTGFLTHLLQDFLARNPLWGGFSKFTLPRGIILGFGWSSTLQVQRAIGSAAFLIFLAETVSSPSLLHESQLADEKA